MKNEYELAFQTYLEHLRDARAALEREHSSALVPVLFLVEEHIWRDRWQPYQIHHTRESAEQWISTRIAPQCFRIAEVEIYKR